jgi:dihydrofolate reductase
MSTAHRPRLVIIGALARNGAIGRDNQLLWRLPEDLKRFKRLTLGHPIVMGRKTFESIGRPLPGRRNIVVTRERGWRAEGVETAHSLDDALALAGDVPEIDVIGGAEIWALALPRADVLQLTEIEHDFEGDAFFPPWPREHFRETARSTHTAPAGWTFHFVTYERIAR